MYVGVSEHTLRAGGSKATIVIAVIRTCVLIVSVVSVVTLRVLAALEIAS